LTLRYGGPGVREAASGAEHDATDVAKAPSDAASSEPPYGLLSTLLASLAPPVDGAGAPLRVLAELPLSGGEPSRKVVLYSALYYDARGNAWVYVSPRPLAYERTPVKVQQVSGDVAKIAGLMQPGTAVVSVGASLLYGIEVFGK